MQPVLDEIARLRNGRPIIIDHHNRNRYCLVVHESDGSKTAYYFSTPIYNRKSRKLVDVNFFAKGGTIYATGSNTSIAVSEKVLLENAEGSCAIGLTQKPVLGSAREVKCGNDAIFPTINGIAMKSLVKDNERITLMLEVDQPFLNVRANNKYFALMRERFRPYVVFSCIGCMDTTGSIIAPTKLDYQKITDKRYCITVSATSPSAKYVLWECNLYENKLFQDTTVESRNPSSNNAFGSVGFIGNTSEYGEQWLYSRLDHTQMPEMMDKHICRAVLHMPRLNRSATQISAFKVAARFCSFGSNWGNKKASVSLVSDSSSDGGYQNIDITSLIVNPRTKTLTRSDGFILRPKQKGDGFSAITTADSYFAPQILEINFK